MRVSGRHAGITMTQSGHDDREARALTSETSGDVVPEVVEVKVPEPEPGDDLPGSAVHN